MVPICVIGIHPGDQRRAVTSSPASQSGARWAEPARRGSAQLNRGERNLNPKHLWRRAGAGKHALSVSQRESGGQVSAGESGPVGETHLERRAPGAHLRRVRGMQKAPGCRSMKKRS